MGCAESDFDFDLNGISVISTAQQIDSTMPKNELSRTLPILLQVS
jgi:hypothetical protein